ncbi:Hint domain-containing protein [Ruegeria sp. R14_0]|uniref:Hint domain-containing protein n=1 Tax=Ruegeria sp. R14_0 TaxID=2821100 RepID=UPI001ADA191F|nr:Hint domain-containing protein [Ruegeria sp. R14_0]MBO9447588.1 Hint domain-containing protein [Ruegeria sp. R14_0]
MVSIVGTTTGTVTGDPPNEATGDLELSGFPLSQNWSISEQPSLGVASIDPNTGEWTYTVDPSEYDDIPFGTTVTDTFTVRVTGLEINDELEIAPYDLTQEITISIEGVCFTEGTLILTEGGNRRIETLDVGDKVMTADHGLQPIRWIESSALPPERLRKNPAMRPVRIKACSLGQRQPERDLLVSQQHRILVSGPKVELLFGAPEVLIAAKHLCSWPGIEIEASNDPVEYYHILLDSHEILTAEGALAESLFLGEESLYTLSSDALQELAAIFPDTPTPNGMGFGRAARRILREFEARALA